MCDGGKGGILNVRPKIELADDPAFIAGVADPCDGSAGWDRLAGDLASQKILQFRGQSCRQRQRASFSFAIRRCVISGWSIMRRERVADW
jgi:hypothetical protein